MATPGCGLRRRADRLADLCAQQQSPGGCAPRQRTSPDPAVLGPLCCRDSKIPEPPAGHRWKEVRFDHTVTWLASWTENIHSSTKYLLLNPSSRLKVRPAPGLLALGTQRGALSTGSAVGRQRLPREWVEVTASSKIRLCPTPLFLKQDFNFTLTAKSLNLDSAPSPQPHPAGVLMAVAPRDPNSRGAVGGQLP